MGKNHSTNKERSCVARKKHSKGRYKQEQWIKWRTKTLEYWREFWNTTN